MQPPTKTKTWANDALFPTANQPGASESADVSKTAAESKEPEEVRIPKKSRRQNSPPPPSQRQPSRSQPPQPPKEGEEEVSEEADGVAAENAQPEPAPQNDMDWLRSKTSRLLGLVDEEEQDVDARAAKSSEPMDANDEDAADPSPDQGQAESSKAHKPGYAPDANIDTIRDTGRLFVRNLPYNASEADLSSIFSPFGKVEEVRYLSPCIFLLLYDHTLYDDHPDRDIRCFAHDVT